MGFVAHKTETEMISSAALEKRPLLTSTSTSDLVQYFILYTCTIIGVEHKSRLQATTPPSALEELGVPVSEENLHMQRPQISLPI